MALLLNYNGNESAYAIVDVVSGNKHSAQMIVTVFSNEEKIEILDNIIYSIPIDVSENAINFIAQGYAFLKTIETFSNATNV